MQITIIIKELFSACETIGGRTILAIPWVGALQIILVAGARLDLRADPGSLTLQPGRTRVYISKGDGWEPRGSLQRIPTA